MSARRLVVLVEGPVDHRLVTNLIRAWTDEGSVPTEFRSCGLHDAESFVPIKEVTRRAKERRIRAFKGGKAGVVRSAMQLLRHVQLYEGLRFDGIVLLIDTDGDRLPDVALSPGLPPCACGYPHECVEAWLVAGSEPRDEHDRNRERRRLGFDPFACPELLSHKDPHPKRAKEVWRGVTVSEEAAATELLRRGLAEAPSSVACGAAAFVREVARLLSDLR